MVGVGESYGRSRVHMRLLQEFRKCGLCGNLRAVYSRFCIFLGQLYHIMWLNDVLYRSNARLVLKICWQLLWQYGTMCDMKW
jgi:hypothetical protein